MEFEPVLVTAIDRLPDDMACAIGHIASAWAVLESVLKLTIYKAAGVPPVVGRICIGTARPEDQLTKIEDLLTHFEHHFDPPITTLKKDVTKAQVERDLIVHGIWAIDPDTDKLVLLDHTGKWDVGPRQPRYTRRMYPLGRHITVHELTEFHKTIQKLTTEALAVYQQVNAFRGKSDAPTQPDPPTPDQNQNKSQDQQSPSQE